ncbi:MAG: DNA ligase, partial [Candidatus Methanomethylicota archaeon]
MPEKFEELCSLCEKLSQISSRISKIDLVASFLRKLNPNEIAPAVRMIIGEVFPSWDQREFEVSGSTLFKVLQDLTGITPMEYLKYFDETGDVGSCFKLIFEVKRKPVQKLLLERPLTIMEVYRLLEEIAKTSGAGSRRKKERILESLLSRASPLEAKYIVKLIIGERRHGFGEGLMEQAIAKAFNVPEDLVRRANMLISDIGHVAQRARESGVNGIKAIDITLFHPIKPMLAEDAESVEDALLEFGGVAAFEVKPDGARVQIHSDGVKVEIFSRRLTNVTKSLPEVVDWIKSKVSAKKLVVEGEVIAIGKDGKPLPFQYVMRRFRRVREIEEVMAKIPVKLYLFDILYVDGKNLVDEPYCVRRAKLEEIADPQLLIPQTVTKEVEVARKFF